MSSYEENKKVRRIAATIYLLIMAILVAGSYLSQQQKTVGGQNLDDLSISESGPH